MENLPLIIIPGFGQSKAELVKENGDKVRVWPLSVDIKQTAKRIAPSYIKTVIRRRDTGFTDTAYKIFSEVFEPFAPDENGNMIHPLQAIPCDTPLSECSEKFRGFVKKLVPIGDYGDKYGYDKIYFFSYNAFDDVYLTAEKLDCFIDKVIAETGSQKVNLLSYSMGGPVTTAYLDEYRHKACIGKILFVAAAIEGSALQADVLKRYVDKAQGYSFLGFVTTEKTVDIFKKVLALTPWEVRYRLLFRSLDAVNDVVLINSAGMWELVPPKDYPKLRDKFIGDDNHAVLRSKTDRYHKTALRVREILTDVQNKGTELFSVAGYGSTIMPLSLSRELSTDTILDISSSSLGGVDNGEVNLDGSFFKDNIRLFKGIGHGEFAKNPEVNDIALRFFSGDKL